MFHQSSGRNPRSKGSNVKKILQVVVLLAVACWLLYQVKHSHDKRTEYSGNDESKVSIGGPEIYLGRKGDAGSENVIIIDTSAQVSDESTEMKQGKVQLDGVNNEDKSKERPQTHELEVSHANDEEETLHQPSEREGDNFSNQNQNSKEEGSILEENGHLKENEKIEDIKSELAVDDTVETTMNGEEGGSNSADQTDSSAGAGKDNEETSGEASNQDLSVDNESPKVEGVDTDGHSRSTSKNSDESKIDHTGDAHSDDDVSSSQSEAASTNSEVDDVFHAGDKVESQGDTTREVEATGAQNAEASNEVTKEGEVEAQLGSVSEAENTESNPLGEIKTDSDSQNEAEKSVSNASDASGNVSVVSEENKASGTEGTTSANDVQENPSSLEANNNEIVGAEGNNDDAKVGKDESQRGDAVEAGHSENNFIDAKNDKETSEQIEKSSEGIEQGGTDDRQQDITAGDPGEAQGTGDGKSEGNSDDAAGSDSVKEISGVEKQGSTVNEKNEAVLNDEATTTSEVNEKATSGDFTNENSTGEGVQAQGDGNSAAESTNNSNTGEAKTEENSNSETEQDSTSLNASSSEGESTEQKAAQ